MVRTRHVVDAREYGMLFCIFDIAFTVKLASASLCCSHANKTTSAPTGHNLTKFGRGTGVKRIITSNQSKLTGPDGAKITPNRYSVLVQDPDLATPLRGPDRRPGLM